MCLSLDNTLASLLTSSTHLGLQYAKIQKQRNGPIKLQTKTLDLGKLPKATNTMLKL